MNEGDRTADERRELVLRALRNAGRVLLALAGAIVIFGVFMKIKGVDPVTAYRDMWDSTVNGNDSLEQILVKATPLILAALAVTVPARAGLVNVGGEGQLVLGGIGAAAVVIWFGNTMPTGVQLLLMALFGAIAGALWAGIAAAMRLLVNVNEAVTTLLLNYVALYLMLYPDLRPVEGPPGVGATGHAAARRRGRSSRSSATARVHAGIFVAIAATVVIWFLLTRTSWGFRLSVVGGNPEAARQAGLRVGLLLLSAMLVGGALAGLGGFTQLAGVEYKLRPNFLVDLRLHRLPGQLARPAPPGASRHRGDAPRGDRRSAATACSSTPRCPRRRSTSSWPSSCSACSGGAPRRRRWRREPRTRGRDRRRTRWHVHPLRRSRRDGVGAGRRGEPRHRGQHALRRARRLRRQRRAGQPVDRRARRRGRRRRARRWCTRTSCSAVARTSSPPASWCCSSRSASPRCSAPRTSTRSSHRSRRGTSRCSPTSPGSARSSSSTDPLTYISLPPGPARVVVPVPQSLGSAGARRRRAHRGAAHLRPPPAARAVRRRRDRRRARRTRRRTALDRVRERVVREHGAGPWLHRRGGRDLRHPPTLQGGRRRRSSSAPRSHCRRRSRHAA